MQNISKIVYSKSKVSTLKQGTLKTRYTSHIYLDVSSRIIYESYNDIQYRISILYSHILYSYIVFHARSESEGLHWGKGNFKYENSLKVFKFVTIRTLFNKISVDTESTQKSIQINTIPYTALINI